MKSFTYKPRIKELVIIERDELPAWLREYEQVRGICIGGCLGSDPIRGYDVEAEYPRWRADELAHAHSYNTDYLRGWICVPFKKCLKYSVIIKHELCHLIANTSEHYPAHGKRYKDTVMKLFPKEYDDII